MYVCCFWTFLALSYIELYGFAFPERFKTFALDVAMVDEDICSIIRGDKAVTLGTIEPFDLTGSHASAPSAIRRMGFAEVYQAELNHTEILLDKFRLSTVLIKMCTA